MPAMTFTWAALFSMILPNFGGWLSSLFMKGQVYNPDGTAWYQTLKKPSWTPNNWLFDFVWPVFYTSMGYAAYSVYVDCGGFTEAATLPLSLYGSQLLFNWTWTPIFFKLHQIGWAFLHMLALDALAFGCAINFYWLDPIACYLLIPYLGWLVFSTVLNYMIWEMNPSDMEGASILKEDRCCDCDCKKSRFPPIIYPFNEKNAMHV